MANSSEEETSSTRSSLEEYSDDDGSETSSSDSGKSKLRESKKTVSGLHGGATGTSDKQSDVCAVALLSASMDDKKRQILDTAVDAILNKKEKISAVRLRLKLTSTEIDQALSEKGAVDLKLLKLNRRVRRPEKTEVLRKAVEDVTVNGMSVTASSRLHKIHHNTLTRELVDQGVQFPLRDNSSVLEAAVQEVIERKTTVTAAGRMHKVDRGRVERRLQALGYVSVGPRRNRKWIKARSEFDNNPENKGRESQDNVNEAQSIQPHNTDQVIAHNNEEYVRVDHPSTVDEKPIESSQEIEKIVDVRTSRQYLVKWQGEEEATWVDEEVFLGLTKLNIEQD